MLAWRPSAVNRYFQIYRNWRRRNGSRLKDCALCIVSLRGNETAARTTLSPATIIAVSLSTDPQLFVCRDIAYDTTLALEPCGAGRGKHSEPHASPARTPSGSFSRGTGSGRVHRIRGSLASMTRRCPPPHSTLRVSCVSNHVEPRKYVRPTSLRSRTNPSSD